MSPWQKSGLKPRKMHKTNKLILIFIGITLLTSCSNVIYKDAQELYKYEKYPLAIARYDQFLEKDRNGALKTKAELARSESYYCLGKKAFSLGKYQVAADLLYLANSEKADSLLDNCHYALAKNLIAEDNYQQAFLHYDFIIENLKKSELLPEILFDKIKIEFEMFSNKQSSYDNYKILADNFPNSPYLEEAKKVVDKYIESFISQALNFLQMQDYKSTLNLLFILIDYPANYEDRIKKEIAKTYFSYGNYLVEQGELIKAEKTFRSVVNYDSSYQQRVNKKLDNICNLYITKGDELLRERKIDEAITLYQQSFNIIENYQPAVRKIEIANQIKKNIALAQEFVEKGDEFFRNKKYKTALTYYQNAYQYDNTKEIAEKVDKAGRWIRIEKDPQQFAKDIIRNYKNGLVVRRISDLEEKVRTKYKKEDISIKKWQVFLGVGSNNYEVRYTIITPEKGYRFLWLVKLETEEVIPLNTATEELE